MIQKGKRYLIALTIIFYAGANSNSSSAQTTDPIESKIEETIKKLTLEEKVAMIHANSSFTSAGVPRLNIPELVTSDGPHGVRLEHGRDWVPDKAGNDSSTYLPVGVAVASTWNPSLGYEFGKVLGAEAKYRGKDVILGPGINIHRTPLNGRNFEYLSEDPYLITKFAVGYIKGVQEQDVAACVKHYLANNQETQRDSINVEVSERALREIYMPGFKAAVQEGKVYTIMGAYNTFRGQVCTPNEYLINKVLKGEWKFDGTVISDWGAVHNTKQALLYGTDIEMGTDLGIAKGDFNKFYLADSALYYIRKGEVKETVLDDKVRRILRTIYRTKLKENRKPGAFTTKEHSATALKIAEEAIVLLKNSGNSLPLKKESIKSIAVIGDNATRKHGMAGGSSQVLSKYEITPLEGIKSLSGNIKITHAPGYKVGKGQGADATLIQEAVKAASSAELAIIVGGWVHGYTNLWDDNAYDAENADKPNMQLPFGQTELFNKVLEANPNTIVVLVGGGPLEMAGWGDKAKAIVQAWYAGQEGGKALAEILFGIVNPSGKLPVTFPKKLEDSPTHKLGEYPGDGRTVRYKEGIFVGYRYFDTYKVQPQYPFGFGLSYTTFDLSNLQVTNGKNSANVKVTVKNTGKVEGAEVVQLYVKDVKSSVERPEKELKGFQKVFLKPGESKVIELTLDESSFSYFDEKKNAWVLEPGQFELLVGNSSQDIKLRKEITL